MATAWLMPAIKELKIVFHLQWIKKDIPSIMEKGEGLFTCSGVVGFSDDGTSFTLKIDMKPIMNMNLSLLIKVSDQKMVIR
jgi:hypothetical protein